MRSTKRSKRKIQLKNVILDNIYNNLKEYIIVTVILLIGIIVGVIFINNVNESQMEEIKQYITNFISSLKGDYCINRADLLKSSLLDNLKLTIGMWFIGSTVIGMPIVLGIVLYRGFCIGYTISSTIAVLRYSKRNYIFISHCITPEYHFCTSFNCISG